MGLPTNLDDLRLYLDALKVLLTTYSIFHGKKEEPSAQVQKEKDVIGQAIHKAEEEIAAPNVDSRRVAEGVEAQLQAELGAEAKDAIIQRASGILAVTRPYEVASFRYYEMLRQILEGGRAFCLANNVFRLRGTVEGEGRVLPLWKFSSALQGLLSGSGCFPGQLRSNRDIYNVSVERVVAFLRTLSEGARMTVSVKGKISDHVGGSYSENFTWCLALVPGREVNRIGFDVVSYPQYYRSDGFDRMITLEEFQDLAFSALADLSGYSSELAQEERTFRDKIGPALEEILAAISRSS